MNATVAAERTVGQVIPWVKTLLDYTDTIMNELPEDDAALDYRPVDPNGGYVFSIREQAMHIADTRHDVLAWITGVSADPRNFCLEYGGTEKPWTWKPATRAEILAYNAAGRAGIEAWLSQPQAELLHVSEHMASEFARNNEKLLADGQDISERVARGPAPVVNTLLFLVAHEQGHRAVLQQLLRLSGNKVTRYA